MIDWFWTGALVRVDGEPPGYEFLDGALGRVIGIVIEDRKPYYTLDVIREGPNLCVRDIPEAFLVETSPLEELARADV